MFRRSWAYKTYGQRLMNGQGDFYIIYPPSPLPPPPPKKQQQQHTHKNAHTQKHNNLFAGDVNNKTQIKCLLHSLTANLRTIRERAVQASVQFCHKQCMPRSVCYVHMILLNKKLKFGNGLNKYDFQD